MLLGHGVRMVMIKTTVDGVFSSEEVEPRLLLVHYLRTRLGRTGTVVGCDTSNCGPCTVLLDGMSVKSCTVLALQVDGAEITTVQGLADGELHAVQKAFHENHARTGRGPGLCAGTHLRAQRRGAGPRVARPYEHRRHAGTETARSGRGRPDARAHPRHAPRPAPPNRDHDRPGAAGDRPAHASHAVRSGA